MKNLIKIGKRKIGVFAFVLITVVGLSSLKNSSIVSEWVAPASANNLKNPVKSTEESIKAGKKLYKSMCSACHGVKGKGDGIAGASLKPVPANFWTDKFQSQSDGAVFWKLSEGRGVMTSYKKSIKEMNRWNIVNYLKSLKK